MDHRTDHRIHIILDGKEYGVRHWVNVPRKGDLIMLKHRLLQPVQFFTAKITQVTWGVAVDDMDTHCPTINLHCKTTRAQKVQME